jgi:hypothetical protein
MAETPDPELKSAITKGVIIDAVLVGVGLILYLVTDEIAWFVGGFILASAIWPLLLAQAGAFTRKDDGR